MAGVKKRAIDILSESFDANQRTKFELDIDGKRTFDFYFKPITRADRLEINAQGGGDDAIKMTTLMLVRKAENEDGTKCFQLGDVAALRRLPEKVLNQMELALFGVDQEGNPIEQLEIEVAKKD
jgi:hypothetical protein